MPAARGRAEPESHRSLASYASGPASVHCTKRHIVNGPKASENVRQFFACSLMGAQGSRSCETQHNNLERVVNVCFRDDKYELSYTRINAYQSGQSPDIDRGGPRAVSTSKWKPQQHSEHKHSEMCCGCAMEDDGKKSIITTFNHGNNALRQGGVIEASRSSIDKKVSFQKHEDNDDNGEDHPRTPSIPTGWTESEMLLLKRAVEKAARTLLVKPPGFAAMQAI